MCQLQTSEYVHNSRQIFIIYLPWRFSDGKLHSIEFKQHNCRRRPDGKYRPTQFEWRTTRASEEIWKCPILHPLVINLRAVLKWIYKLGQIFCCSHLRNCSPTARRMLSQHKLQKPRTAFRRKPLQIRLDGTSRACLEIRFRKIINIWVWDGTQTGCQEPVEPTVLSYSPGSEFISRCVCSELADHPKLPLPPFTKETRLTKSNGTCWSFWMSDNSTNIPFQM